MTRAETWTVAGALLVLASLCALAWDVDRDWPEYANRHGCVPIGHGAVPPVVLWQCSGGETYWRTTALD